MQASENKRKVSIVDYGMGNLFSVEGAVRHSNAEPVLVSGPEEISTAERLLIPGVGAFGDGMDQIRERGMLDAIREFAAEGKPILGICLGMQLLFETSSEFGENQGLGIIPGDIIPIPTRGPAGESIRVPHVGWNELLPTHNGSDDGWNGTILEGASPGSSVYSVHSFFADCTDTPYDLAECVYHGIRLPAVVGHGNVTGCQFHPEKSGAVGLKILASFLNAE